VAQNCHKYYILFLLRLYILQAKLESRIIQISISSCIPIRHNGIISLCLWSFSFKSHKNRIYLPFHQLTAHYDVQIQVNQRICIDRGQCVLLTIISNLAFIGKANRFSWIRFTNSLVRFFSVLS
jgi:hypothetical protein